MAFQLLPYSSELRTLWDETASRCRQNSFLFRRDFMDYHRDRFPDRSVLFVNQKGRGIALFRRASSITMSRRWFLTAG